MQASESARVVAQTTVEFVFDLREAATGRGHRRNLAELSGIDVSSTERWVLHAIPGLALLPVSQLATDLGMDLPLASRTCARLETEGHVVRLRDPRDGRRTLVGLTEATNRAMAHWDATWHVPYQSAVDGWTDNQKVTLRDWFRLVLDTWSTSSTNRPPQDETNCDDAVMNSLVTVVRSFVGAAGTADLITESRQPDSSRLTPAQFHTLRTLAKTPQGLTAQELASLTDVDRSLAKRRLTALQEAGVVKLGPFPANPYVVSSRGLAQVTEVARAHAARLPAVPEHLVERGLGDLLLRYVAAIHVGASEGLNP